MKLKHCLVFRTVALTALVFGVFGAILIQSAFLLQFAREKNALEARSAQLVQSMEAAAVNYALQNIALTDQLLSDILSQLDATASLLDTQTPPAGESIRLSECSLYALRPVYIAGQTRCLLTAADLSALYQTRSTLLVTYSILYLSAIVVFSVVMTLTAGSLTRPVERLSQVSARLAAGELTVRADSDDLIETKLLARSFNEMADSLTGQIERQNRFIADLTHEMKTPLTAIIGHADLIRSGRIAGDDVLLAAHSILKEGQRMNELTARLIELILLGQDQADLRPAQILPLVEAAADALRPAAESRGIELIVRCDHAEALCDRPLMQSLIANLIDNALKSGASCVRAEGRLTSDAFTLSVADNGRGMTQDVLSRITEPFYRADKSRSREQGGAGLGLSLCAEIARLHHAILSFDSQPGIGTTVSLSLRAKEVSRS